MPLRCPDLIVTTSAVDLVLKLDGDDSLKSVGRAIDVIPSPLPLSKAMKKFRQATAKSKTSSRLMSACRRLIAMVVAGQEENRREENINTSR